MIRNILVPIDYQDLSANAVGLAVDLARALMARLHLLYVAPNSAFESQEQDRFLADIGGYLNELQREYQDVVVDHIVTNGDSPAMAIAQEIRDKHTDLVVVSTHGRGGLQRWMMGSVTESLMHHSSCPVLVANASSGSTVPGRLRLCRILVPVDGSSFSEQALEQAGDLARGVGAHLTLLHVIEPLSPSAATVAPLGGGGAESFDDAQGYLASLHVADVPAETRLAVGSPARVIVDAGGHADLIVMATHGRTGVARLLMGSTTEGVVRQATVPVLVLTRQSLARQTEMVSPGVSDASLLTMSS